MRARLRTPHRASSAARQRRTQPGDGGSIPPTRHVAGVAADVARSSDRRRTPPRVSAPGSRIEALVGSHRPTRGPPLCRRRRSELLVIGRSVSAPPRDSPVEPWTEARVGDDRRRLGVAPAPRRDTWSTRSSSPAAPARDRRGDHFRFAARGAKRIAIGHRGTAMAEECREEFRARPADLLLVRGNVTSEARSRAGPGHSAARRARPHAATAVSPALETEPKHGSGR